MSTISAFDSRTWGINVEILSTSRSLKELEIAAPILIIIGYKTKIAASLLAAFCVTTALLFHSDFSNQMQITSFLKNIGLAGGFLFIVVNGPKKYSLDNKEK